MEASCLHQLPWMGYFSNVPRSWNRLPLSAICVPARSLPPRGAAASPHATANPGHGPNPRLTYKVCGKTVTESLPNPAAVRKAEREIAEFRNLQALHKEFVDVNAQICQLRPAEAAPQQTREKNSPGHPTRSASGSNPLHPTDPRRPSPHGKHRLGSGGTIGSRWRASRSRRRPVPSPAKVRPNKNRSPAVAAKLPATRNFGSSSS